MWGYELWDTETGNLISSFGDEGPRSTRQRRSCATAALVRFDDEQDGEIGRLAAGNELLARVRQIA